MQHCATCDGIDLVWDTGKEDWVAPYVEAGFYCECSTEELEARKGLTTHEQSDIIETWTTAVTRDTL